ncbi:MAG TPA: hypothetical protein VGC13_22200 [Longimicrobium sp.]|jgi:hypothetical protein|uniref:hypothetical protein n=1 Tax=Longimicrobium sp. TaxID=2029185 RepID=UPI002ED93063
MAENEILAELRQIRREMLAEVGGDMDGLFRAIKAEEAEQARQGKVIVSLPPRRPQGYEPNAA